MLRSICPAMLSMLATTSYAFELKVPRPEFLLPPPPPEGSIEARADREYIKYYVNSVPFDRLRMAESDAKNESLSIFQSTLPLIKFSELPSVERLFEKIRIDERKITEFYKHYFDRKRPYQLDKDLEICSRSKKIAVSSSNPSGHSVMAFTFAIVLADLLPEYASLILNRAEIYAQNRVLCGAHHLFDVRSGQVLGTIIGLEVLRSTEFKDLLDAAREELFSKSLDPR